MLYIKLAYYIYNKFCKNMFNYLINCRKCVKINLNKDIKRGLYVANEK